MSGPEDDPLPEAVALVDGAAARGCGCGCSAASGCACSARTSRRGCGPARTWTWPARPRDGGTSPPTSRGSGCVPDKMFNSLNGDRQMYFTAPSGRAIDVMVDRLVMCHTLDLRPSFGNSSLTLDPPTCCFPSCRSSS